MIHMAQTKGTKVILASRSDITGYLTGGSRPCALEGCGGTCLAIRWSDGKLSYLCDAVMHLNEKGELVVR